MEWSQCLGPPHLNGKNASAAAAQQSAGNFGSGGTPGLPWRPLLTCFPPFLPFGQWPLSCLLRHPGSTALAARLDPEDMAAVIASYHKAVADAVRGEDGFIAKYMGDGVLAYFGYPRAHENDAERAVRAGLAVAEAVPKLENVVGLSLQVRVGVATGVVAISSDPANQASTGWWATRRIWRRVCKGSQSPTASSSPRRRDGCSATFLSLRTSLRHLFRADKAVEPAPWLSLGLQSFPRRPP